LGETTLQVKIKKGVRKMETKEAEKRSKAYENNTSPHGNGYDIGDNATIGFGGLSR
jgi:hypothetical protein